MAVQKNQSSATVADTAKANVGGNVILPAVVILTASGGSTFDVLQDGGTGALAGGGSNSAEAKSSMSILASLGDGAVAAPGKQVDLLMVTATQTDTSMVKAKNGLGVAVGIALVNATLTDETITKVAIGKVGTADGMTPLKVGSLLVSADRTQKYSTTAESYFGGLVAAGNPYSKYQANKADARVEIGAGANILAAGVVAITSSHTIKRTTNGYSTKVAGGGLAAVAGLDVTQDISGTTTTIDIGSKVVLGDNVKIVSGSGLTNPGGISLLPKSTLQVQDIVGAWTAGGGAASVLQSQTTATVTTNVEIGNNVTLFTYGDLAIGTLENATATNKVEGRADGGIAGIKFNSTVNVTSNQQISFGTNASLTAAGMIWITTAQDASGDESQNKVEANVDGTTECGRHHWWNSLDNYSCCQANANK